MTAALTIEETDILWTPNSGGQQGFMDDYHTRYCAFAGGWFAGKTWAGARKMADLHVHNAFDDDGNPTFVSGLVIAQSYSLAATVSMPALREAFDEMGLRYKFIADIKQYCFVFLDLGTVAKPSLMYVRSAEAPEAITGLTVGHEWGDEAARWTESLDPKRDTMTQVLGRLRDDRARVQQANFTYTNEGDSTAVYKMFEERPRSNCALYRGDTHENPHAAQFATDMEDTLSKDLAEQYLKGKAISVRGNRMYSGFDKAHHVAPKTIRLRSDLPLQLRLDFNIDPGMYGLLGQYDQRADLYVTAHEIHKPRMAVPQLVASMVEIVNKTYGGYKWPGSLQVYGDASGQNESAARGDSPWQVISEYLDKYGIPFVILAGTHNPLIADRVNAMNAALEDARGHRHVLIDVSCTQLVDDFEHMKWDKAGNPDKVNKKRSHPSDADSYGLWAQRPIRKMERPVGEVSIVRSL